MKRTPRSASLRARRQLAAYVPGLRESGPYNSKVDSGSFERSIRGGTEVCIRYAISYCATRVSISGSAYFSASKRFNLAMPSSIRRLVVGDTPGGFDKYSTGSPLARNFTPWYRDGRNPLPHKRENSGWSGFSALACEISTTNAGKFWFSLPSP